MRRSPGLRSPAARVGLLPLLPPRPSGRQPASARARRRPGPAVSLARLRPAGAGRGSIPSWRCWCLWRSPGPLQSSATAPRRRSGDPKTLRNRLLHLPRLGPPPCSQSSGRTCGWATRARRSGRSSTRLPRPDSTPASRTGASPRRRATRSRRSSVGRAWPPTGWSDPRPQAGSPGRSPTSPPSRQPSPAGRSRWRPAPAGSRPLRPRGTATCSTTPSRPSTA